MALVFHRRLALPLWAIAFFTVALTAPPPATPFLIAVLGIALIAFTMPEVSPWWRTSPSVVHILSHGYRHKTSAAITMAAGTCVRTLDEPNGSTALDEPNGITAEDALDLVRMDDDGGWQMARPPA
jgi:hypothetical protein